MPKVSVIIPFFQRKEGILRSAVLSVLNQKTSADVKVVIVDDQSPIPAKVELKDLLLAHPESLHVLEQKNAGVGAARNAGLDHLGPEVDFVAFLDSDDAWTDLHIEHAVWTLENGYDFYFADFYQLNQSITAFNRAGRINIEQHRRIHDAEPLYEYVGDMVNQIVTGNIIGTSTVAYNFREFSKVRFPVDFRHAGEDYIFWVRLTSQMRKIGFSAEPECRYGPGVNLFSDSGWGTDKYLNVLHDDIKYKKYLLANFKLTPSQRATLESAVKRLRTNYGKGFLHNLIHNRRVDQNVIWKQLKMDPMTLLSMASSPAVVAFDKFRRSNAG